MDSRPSRLSAIGAALATWLVTFAVAAQPSSADRETARSLMQEGRDLRDKSDLKGALARFKAADDIMHVPTTALEVARTQVSLGLLVEALDTIATLRKTPTQPDDPQPFKDARVKADELDSQVEGRVPSLVITVTGAAEGDVPAISMDGTSLLAAVSGLPRKVDPGHHVVTAHAAGGDAKEAVDVAEGEKKEVRLTLVAGGPLSDEEAPRADREEGKTAVVHTPGAVAYAGFVAGGAGVAFGTVTGILALSKASSLKGECAGMHCPPGQPTSDLNSGTTLATLSTVSFAVAVAGAGVGIVALVVGHKPADAPASGAPVDPDASPGSTEPPAEPSGASASRSGVRVTPWIGAGSAGFFGTF